MATDRFYVFTQLIDGIHKCIYKMKIDFAPYVGVKSVHMFWIYELAAHPEGLTCAELAEKNMISRSLVSREIECLRENGYIVFHETARGKRKNYNSRITLTEKGHELAGHIRTKAMDVQSKVNEGVSEEELAVFYAILEKLACNMQAAVREGDAVEKEPKAADCKSLHKEKKK